LLVARSEQRFNDGGWQSIEDLDEGRIEAAVVICGVYRRGAQHIAGSLIRSIVDDANGDTIDGDFSGRLIVGECEAAADGLMLAASNRVQERHQGGPRL
jgi:hypothetical protein